MTMVDPQMSPAGARRERPVTCRACARRQTWNHDAVCDRCRLRPCSVCGRPATDDRCSECDERKS